MNVNTLSCVKFYNNVNDKWIIFDNFGNINIFYFIIQ